MNDNIADKIRDALAVEETDLLADARQFLDALGYRSERIMPGTPAPKEFLRQFAFDNNARILAGINAKELIKCAENVGVVFQVSDQEIRESGSLYAADFDPGDKSSFFFVAVQLRAGREYPRWRLARMTRAINHCFASPAVVLFRHSDADKNHFISLSFVHRRESKTRPDKDVIGRISILRAVRRDRPHRGHMDILRDLALPSRLAWITNEKKTKNFAGLRDAWLSALDTEELNKRFYARLFDWFSRAVQEAKFPNPPEKPIAAEAQAIRLVTRLLFIWFIREKGLVADDFFRREKVRELLKRFDTKDGDYYYCAILQNLFFATLNTEIPRRGFSEEARKTHRNFNLYRHAHMLANRDKFLELAGKTPFVNGGLFDCMDSEETRASGGEEWRQDCFSDTVHNAPEKRDAERRKTLFIPDGLFFAENERWRELQKERAQSQSVRAYENENSEQRERRLLEINNAFERYARPFGRKLFLIQNSIYGVDIQTTACQIAKLRIFISLAIEQIPNDNMRENYGIRPLPNLETRFVAADALIRPPPIELRNNRVRELERELAENSERHFNARARDEKLRCIKRGKKLRLDLKRELDKLKFGSHAGAIADWNPFDQNARAKWFDPEWMFYVPNGFDIVIGNPPYVKLENMDAAQKARLKALYSEEKPGARKATAWVDDLYVHFIFRGHELLREGGVMTYIANDSFVGLKSKERVRRLFLNRDLRGIVRCPPDTFGATIYTAIFLLKKAESEAAEYESGELADSDYDYRNFGRVSYETTRRLPYSRLSIPSPMLELTGRLLAKFPAFGKSFSVLDTGIHSGNVRSRIFFAGKTRKGLSRLLQGKQIERWRICWDAPGAKFKWCDPDYEPQAGPGVGRKGRPSKKEEYWHFCGDRENHELPERLLLRQTADNLVAAYHSEEEDGQFYTDNTLFTVRCSGKSAPPLEYGLALLNSRLLNAVYGFLAQEGGKTLAQVKTGLVVKLPLAIGTKSEVWELAELAERITIAKRADRTTDTSELEEEIDDRVFALYGLTEEEVRLVTGGGEK